MLYMQVVKRENSEFSSQEESICFFFFSFLSIWYDGCSLNLLYKSFHEVYKSNHFVVHFKLNTVPYVNHIYKTGRRKNKAPSDAEK